MSNLGIRLQVHPLSGLLSTSLSAGTRDRQGRAVVQVCLRGLPWSSEHTSSTELTRLLRYLHTVPRSY